jgi:uncharacterized protein YerC
MYAQNRSRRGPSPRTLKLLEAVEGGRKYKDIAAEFGITDSCVGRTARLWGLRRNIVQHVTKTCAVCAKSIRCTVKVPKTYCSRQCFYIGLRIQPSPAMRRFRQTQLQRSLPRRKRTCVQCGKNFLAPFATSPRRYCSKRCSSALRPFQRHSPEWVEAVLAAVRAGRTYESIGTEFGVTRQAVQQLARRWGLPARLRRGAGRRRG